MSAAHAAPSLEEILQGLLGHSGTGLRSCSSKLPPVFLRWELRPGYEAAKCSQNQPFLKLYLHVCM